MPDNRLPTNQSLIDLKDSIDLLNANINRTASNIPYDSNLTIKAAIDGKVSKAGDTIEGNLDIDRKNGTAGTEGNTFLNLGNNIPKSSAGNSTGNLRVYGDTGYGVVLNAVNNMTGNQYASLPNKSGTIALTSDVDGTTIDIDSVMASGNPRSINLVNKSRILGKQVIINVTFTSAITASNSPGMVYMKSNPPKIPSAFSCVKLASNGDIEAVVGAYYSLANGSIYVKEVTNGSNYVLTGCYAID